MKNTSSPTSSPTSPATEEAESDVLDALVLGGGFGGLHMLYQLREMGLKALALEACAGVGGAWYMNRYPGARCDVESLVYCYSFSPAIDAEWRWSERYSAQPEIQRYLNFVCDRLDLRKDIRFNSRLVKAVYDEDTNIWNFETASGDTYRAYFFVSSAGPITAPIWPDIPDRDTYKGELYHSAMWPMDEPIYEGKRIGVIGTGSSGTQLIPIVAKTAGHMTVFVRTPAYCIPAQNHPLSDAHYRFWQANRDAVRAKQHAQIIGGSGDVLMADDMLATRNHSGHEFTPEERRKYYQKRYDCGGAALLRTFSDLMTDFDLNEEISEFVRAKVGETVKDPATAALLTPRDYRFGTKRPCIGTDFYETFNRANVEAIDVKANPIERFTEKGLIVGGEEIELDMIICASGFDALTGALTRIEIRGVGGKTIKETWKEGAATYLGLGVAGFPNMLMIGGPGSPSVLVNVVYANEYQVRWIAALLDSMRRNGYDRVDVAPEAQKRWTRTVQDVIQGTVMTTANSWYVGANVPGKKQEILAFAGGLAAYRDACDRAAGKGYEGFRFSRKGHGHSHPDTYRCAKEQVTSSGRHVIPRG